MLVDLIAEHSSLDLKPVPGSLQPMSEAVGDGSDDGLEEDWTLVDAAVSPVWECRAYLGEILSIVPALL